MADSRQNELRFVLLSNLPPYPATGGGNQRTDLLYRALSTIGEVDLLLVHSFGGEDEAALRTNYRLVGNIQRPSRNGHGKLPSGADSQFVLPRGIDNSLRSIQQVRKKYAVDPRAAEALRKTVAEKKYDCIVSHYLLPVSASGATEMDVPVLMDIDDVDYKRHDSLLNTMNFSPLGRARTALESLYIRRRVKAISRRCAHAWVVREEDRPSLRCAKISLLPNIPFNDKILTGTPPAVASAGKAVLFVGSFDYIINVRAVDHFVREVWPKIRSQAPDAVFRIVGREGGNAAYAEAAPVWRDSPGVELLGFVDDVGDAYRDCAFSVCPINEGAGTKIKVIESLAYGRACVVTKHSHRGYEKHLKDRESILIANSDDELAKHCLRLLNHPEEAVALASRGQQIAREHFSFAGFAKRIQEDVAAAVRR